MLKKIVISLFLVGFLGTGIWIYFNPVPVSGCPERSYVTDFIFVYGDESDSSKIRLPGAYFWNFNCPKNAPVYDGKTDKKIFISGHGMNFHSVADVDVETFQSFLESGYARDTNNSYFYGKKIIGVDTPTFEHFTSLPLAHKRMLELAKDKNNVFKGSENIGANSATFETIGGDVTGYYFKDRQNIYWINSEKSVTLPGANLETFHYLGPGIAYDKNNTYHGASILPDLRPRGLIYLGEGFFKNRFQVYNVITDEIIGADSGTFNCDPESREGTWLTECGDAENYYYFSKKTLKIDKIKK